MDAGARLYVAKLVRRVRGSVCFVEDVTEPRDDGRYVTLDCYCEGERALTIVLTVENFYAALAKVVAATMPESASIRIN